MDPVEGKLGNWAGDIKSEIKGRINCDPNSLHGWVDPDAPLKEMLKKPQFLRIKVIVII